MDLSISYKNAPQDVKDTAKELVRNYGFNATMLEGAIAAALYTEREKCALRIEHEPAGTDAIRKALHHGWS